MTGTRSADRWDSLLSCQEFAALASAGFAPVGQVFGAAVFASSAPSGTLCPGPTGASAPADDAPGPADGAPPLGDIAPTPGDDAPTPGDGALTLGDGVRTPGDIALTLGDGVRTPGDIAPTPGDDALMLGDGAAGPGDPGGFGPLVAAGYRARRAALDRMAADCAALGGHGVVGVRLERGPFDLSGLEFTAAGTAVRAVGTAAAPPVPFTCGLSGQDFARLVTAGWVPAGLVLGIAIGSRHDNRTTARQARPWSGNAEIDSWTALVNQTRHDARRRLADDVSRLGAEGVVIAGIQLHATQRDCPAAVGRHDHVAEVTITGTAIASFAPASPSPAPPSPASLSPASLSPARLSPAGLSPAGSAPADRSPARPALAVMPLGIRPGQSSHGLT
jgi:uncharacterized protein YbjQ (UPF0145 family)